MLNFNSSWFYNDDFSGRSFSFSTAESEYNISVSAQSLFLRRCSSSGSVHEGIRVSSAGDEVIDAHELPCDESNVSSNNLHDVGNDFYEGEPGCDFVEIENGTLNGMFDTSPSCDGLDLRICVACGFLVRYEFAKKHVKICEPTKSRIECKTMY